MISVMTTRTKLTVAIVAICFIVSAVLLNGQSTYVTGATGTFITNAATRLRMTATNLLGRTASGSGPIQEIAIGSGLVMTNQTLSATGGGGGTTINSTDGVIPVRGDATTFTNSPIKVVDPAAMFVFGSNTNFIFNAADAEMFIGPNTLAYIGSFGGSGSRILSYTDVGAGETDNNQIYLISVDGTNSSTVSLEALPSNNSTAVRLVDSTSGVNRSAGIDVTPGSTDRIYVRNGGTNTFVSSSDASITAVSPSASTNFYAASSSGYTGGGTKFLSDDGTYKTSGTMINSTDGVIPVRGSATTFTNSPLSVDGNLVRLYGTIDQGDGMSVWTNFFGQSYGGEGVMSVRLSTNNTSDSLYNELLAGSLIDEGSKYGGYLWFESYTNYAVLKQLVGNFGSNNGSGFYMRSGDDDTYWWGYITNRQFSALDSSGSLTLVSNSGTNFYAAASSGYTGGGTNFLSDDGTYKVPAIIGQSGSVTNNGISWTVGSGSPEGAIIAPIGSFYSRTDGSTNTTWYVKVSGAGNTGWVAK